MRTAPGFSVDLVASEPDIRQPLAMQFDDRGRLWVLQYIQYPTPAGLKAVEVDQYLRTKYNELPEPPPKGPKGADKITICEDTDGDGKADKFTDFVTGLNLATGFALGHGGVYVVQPPYLLFYPDKNHNDRPDDKPEVLLTGFGMEDAHAFANSLQWGPDGWLYGAQGSTVTAKLRGYEFQQGVWRYHPATREFELFAEGGGNTWGVDFDEHGNLIVGTNFGDQIGLHQVQGGYYVKGFAKHGPLHNPNTFGYFEHIPYTGFRGGHVTCGGILYGGNNFPPSFQGKYIAANILANSIYWHNLEPVGSSFKGKYGGELLTTDDQWFRPVDLATGPDGALYIADWYDKRATHLDPKDTWDRSNGRIYRVRSGGAPRREALNLRKLTSKELMSLLENPNDWQRREARRLLGDRKDETVYPALEKLIFRTGVHRVQLEALWALYVSGGFEGVLADRLLKHDNPDVRVWAVRFIGDAGVAPPSVTERLLSMARTESSPVVRNQLACSLRRMAGPESVAMLGQMLRRDIDAADPQIPLLLWWALEAKVGSQREAVLALFKDSEFWSAQLVRETIIERFARRLVSDAKKPDFAAAQKLSEMAPNEDSRKVVFAGMNAGLTGSTRDRVSSSITNWFKTEWPRRKADPDFVRLAVRLGSSESLVAAIQRLNSPEISKTEFKSFAELAAEREAADAVPALLARFQKEPGDRSWLLPLLRRFGRESVAEGLIGMWNQFNPEMQKSAIQALTSRAPWAIQLVNAVGDGRIPKEAVSVDALRQMGSLKDAGVGKAAEKVFGKLQPSDDKATQAALNRVKLLLRPSGVIGRTTQGDVASGKAVFAGLCGKCHRLNGEGASIGPDLTGVNRTSLDDLLMNVVFPSAFIRPEFASVEVTTRDGESIGGLLAENSENSVVVLDAAGQKHSFAKGSVKEIKDSKLSLMPEGLLEALKDQEIQDLFAYLQADTASAK